jgi:hypothetical protein
MATMGLQSDGGRSTTTGADRDAGAGRSLVSAVPLRARLWLAGGGLAAAALIVALVLAAPGSTAAPSAERVTTGSLASFHHAMVVRLDAQRANYHWVACVRSGKRFDGVPIVRCNVNFGDPHIQAYCSVFRGGMLLTSQEDPAIPCGHDDAGYSISMQTFG